MKRLAVFDFDGTLSKGYISMEFMDHVHTRGLYNTLCYDKQMEILAKHKRGDMEYEDWCRNWAELWSEGLRGHSENEIMQEAGTFFQRFRKNIHPSAYKIMRKLKWRGYHLVCLSLGAYEPISFAAQDLGMHETYATKANIKKGIYVGGLDTNLHVDGGKEEQLERLIREGRYNLDKSISMGDSHTDIGFMKMLEVRIASNPNDRMREHAEREGWPILYLGKMETKEVIQRIKSLL